MNIRKFIISADSLDELVGLGTLTPQVARFLEASVAAGLNIIVAGGTQAGKTTLLNCLAAAIPARERVVTCEEVFELRIPLPDVVSMQTRQSNLEGTGEVRLRRLVKEALRMRPERILVGEVRQEECLDLLIALNSGLPGMCTIHANSAREAITKLCTLPLLAGENVSHSFVVPTVASSIDVVVHVVRDVLGQRRVREVVAVPGRVEGDIVETADVFLTRDDRLVRADGWPPHDDRYQRAGFELRELLGSVAGVRSPRTLRSCSDGREVVGADRAGLRRRRSVDLAKWTARATTAAAGDAVDHRAGLGAAQRSGIRRPPAATALCPLRCARGHCLCGGRRHQPNRLDRRRVRGLRGLRPSRFRTTSAAVAVDRASRAVAGRRRQPGVGGPGWYVVARGGRADRSARSTSAPAGIRRLC